MFLKDPSAAYGGWVMGAERERRGACEEAPADVQGRGGGGGRDWRQVKINGQIRILEREVPVACGTTSPRHWGPAPWTAHPARSRRGRFPSSLRARTFLRAALRTPALWFLKHFCFEL